MKKMMPTPHHVPACVRLLTATLLSAALLGALCGCVTEGKKNIPKQPLDSKPAVLLVTATQPEDTDSNGYPDSTLVTVYVFTDRTEYEMPIQVPGSLTFRLVDPKGKELARWVYDEQQTLKAQRRLPGGPGYVFGLSLLDVGTDELPTTVATMAATFTPKDGRPVQRAASATLRLGRQNRQGGDSSSGGTHGP
jgi:hypothetical protein